MRRRERRMMTVECGMENSGGIGSFYSPFSIPHSSFRRAFSLLELMIAIVILGIGMVMVATIFPIGIDMAAQTVQMNIAQSATDAAIATLRLKVPPRFNPAAVGSAMVAAPDVSRTEFGPIPDPVDIDPSDLAALNLSGQSTLAWDTSLVTNDPAVIERLRFFTERSGWTGQNGASGPGEAWEYAYVMPSQNLPPAYASVGNLVSFPPMIPPTLGQMPHVFSLNLVDQVYPPVPLISVNPATNNEEARPMAVVLRDLADRRYGWIAIHRMIESSDGKSRFAVTLLVTHRSNLANRYARQADDNGNNSDYVPVFATDARQRLLLAPVADSGQYDTLFPQPWLVRFTQVNIGTGEVRCTKAVADLLPPGSLFVVARTMYHCDAGGNPISGPVLNAGTAYEVLSRQPGSTDWTLQIRRQQPIANAPPWAPSNANNPRAREIPFAWVVPPAIERSGNAYSFQAKSPVAGVFMRIVQP